MERTYLGDGVYAQYEYSELKLYTEREEGEHYIYLDPQIWTALKAFVEKFWNPKEKNHA